MHKCLTSARARLCRIHEEVMNALVEDEGLESETICDFAISSVLTNALDSYFQALAVAKTAIANNIDMIMTVNCIKLLPIGPCNFTFGRSP